MTNTDNGKDIGRLEEAVDTLKDVAEALRKDRDSDRTKFFDVFQSMNSNLVKISTSMDNMSEKFESHVEHDERIHANNDNRIKSLEGSRLKGIGYASGAGVVGSGILTVLSRIFFK